MTAVSKSLYSSFSDVSVPTASYNDNTGTNGYGQLVYPSDLFQDSVYSDSYTAYFISFKEDPYIQDSNTISTSEFYKSNNYTPKGSDTIQSINASGMDDKTITNTVVGIGSAVAIGTYLHSKHSKDKEPDSQSVLSYLWNKGKTFLLSAGGGAAAATANNYGGFLEVKKDKKTQKCCICLPTPIIVSNYEINWSEESNKLFGGILAGGADFIKNITTDTIESGLSGVLEKLGNVTGSTAMSAGSGLSAAALSSPMVGTALGLMTREAPNPRKEQLFKDVGMREFNISYVFAPTSEQEAKNVESIIQQFKYHAHPSYRDKPNSGANGNLLNYPSEFDIFHYFNNKRNIHLPKHATSVLKKVSVDYSNGSDNYTFLPNGMPSIIKLDLTFAELAMLTKEDIMEGY